MDSMLEFPYEVWLNGVYLNAYAGLTAAIAKASLHSGARVYEWIPARHVRVHRYLAP